jgi:GTPase involved in cell partitioning and DNA repair
LLIGNGIERQDEKRFCPQRELELYQDGMLDRPSILVINKMDTPGAEVCDVVNMGSASVYGCLGKDAECPPAT